MVNLIERATTIYFRMPDDTGITHNQIKALANLKNMPFSDDTMKQIDAIKAEIDALLTPFDITDYLDPEYKKVQGIIIQKYRTIEEIKKCQRPFGRGVSLNIETRDPEKFGWFCYYESETLSEEEVSFIKKYIKDTLDSDEVIIEVDYYKLDDTIFETV